MLPQQYCLRWKYHHSNLQTMFSQLLDRGCFCDVTLACEGQLIRAHRVVLCACSTFFDTVLTNYASERDPIIIMKDVTFADVKALIEFMYKGEINVEHANLASLLKTADDLKIKGLAEVSWRDDEDVANGVSGGAPPPPADTEYSTNSPQRMHDGYTISAAAPDMRGSPIGDNGIERRSAASPIHNSKHQLPTRLPMLTPIPSSSITIATASSADHYLGPKRKRGRPPLDDAYDVFNVRKLTHYAGHLDSQPFHDTGRLHATQHEDQQQRHSTSAYQQHIHQQQRRQRQKNEQKQHAADSDDADDNQTDPEWITSNLEVNVAECEAASAMGQTERESNVSPLAEPKSDKLELNEKEPHPESSPAHNRERSPTETRVAASERNSPKVEQRFKKRSVLEKAKEQRQRESKEREKMENKHNEDIKNSDHEDDHATLLPQPVEEIESAHQQKAANTNSAASATNASSASSSELPSTSSQSKIATNSSSHSHTHGHAHSQSHAHSHGGPSISATHGHAHAHFGKYGVPGEGGGGAGGYVLNEHGMLMTHDFPTHGAVMAATTSNGDHDFVDIKMEDYDAADLRLTSEEMSQWQDVIKMDDYLAKGRRPQFWEEPFTRRVLDAIKNKRLEMKKAARILGVSYGTLYGRYREVYGCLKHPYSSTMRPSQSSQLAAVQPRFDIVWPSPKRDSGLLPAPLEIGKIRPKDLSELWARPQI